MRDRALWFVAAFSIGLGAGVLLYQFAILGVYSNGSLDRTLPGIAAGLFAIGFVVLHSVHAKHVRPRVVTRIALGIAGFGAAMGVLHLAVPSVDQLPLARRQLPGFSIELPVVTPTEQFEYAMGNIEIADLTDARFTVQLAWSRASGAGSLEAKLRALADFVEVHETPTEISMPGPDGLSVRTMGVGFEKGTPIRVSEIACGTRTFFLMSLGGAWMESVHRRMLASAVCTPDPAKENAAPPIRVVLELPGWRVRDKSSSVTLTDGDSELSISETPQRNWTMVELAAMLPAVLQKFGAVVAKPPIDDRIPFDVALDGGPAVGWLRYVPCSTYGITLIAVARTEEQAHAIYTASKNARCPRDGEAPSEWPLSTSE